LLPLKGQNKDQRFHVGDVAVGPIFGVATAGHRRIFCRHPEGIPAHRMQDIVPRGQFVARDDVAPTTLIQILQRRERRRSLRSIWTSRIRYMITYEAPPAAGELKPVDSNVHGILHESAGKMDLQSPPGKRDSFGVGDDSSSDVGASKDMNDVLYAGDDLNSDHALSSDNHSKPRPPDEASVPSGLEANFKPSRLLNPCPQLLKRTRFACPCTFLPSSRLLDVRMHQTSSFDVSLLD